MTSQGQRESRGDETFVHCPLCGFEFQRGDTLCHHGCPLESFCRLVRCPSCAYEFAGEARPISWLRRLLSRRAAPPPVPGEVVSLRLLEAGEGAEVVCVADGDGTRRNSLAVFGLVPGAEVKLLQRRPAFVLQVGETELALEADIAGEILVRRAA